VRQTVGFVPAVEPPRSEWFVRGTESAQVEVVTPAQRAPKILYPAEHSINALDPDIPGPLQRVDFRAQAGRGLRWRLNGVELGPADQDIAWTPAPGRHALALVDGAGRSLARVEFEVRGALGRD
jgi:penicillin-binding protein 1C